MENVLSIALKDNQFANQIPVPQGTEARSGKYINSD